MYEFQYKSKKEFYELHQRIGTFNHSVLYDFFRPPALQGKKLLDLGCGEGFDMEYYSRLEAQ